MWQGQGEVTAIQISLAQCAVVAAFHPPNDGQWARFLRHPSIGESRRDLKVDKVAAVQMFSERFFPYV